jgi:hypothetical protein
MLAKRVFGVAQPTSRKCDYFVKKNYCDWHA